MEFFANIPTQYDEIVTILLALVGFACLAMVYFAWKTNQLETKIHEQEEVIDELSELLTEANKTRVWH